MASEWNRGFRRGRTAALRVVAQHGILMAEACLRDLEAAPPRRQFGVGYRVGYRDACEEAGRTFWRTHGP